MLRRIYIDNFKCFINFELQLERVTLLAGQNGSGKSTLMDMVTDIPSIVLAGLPVAEFFPEETLNRWETRTTQIVELDFQVEQGLYRYRLVVDQLEDRSRGIAQETLTLDGQLVFEYRAGEASLYRDDKGEAARFPTGSRISALSVVGDDRKGFARVAKFKSHLFGMILVQANPDTMSSDARRESQDLSVDLSNFASWYRFAIQADTVASQGLFKELADVMPGFVSMKFRSEGKSKVLVIAMRGPGDEVREFGLDELSSGQRLLVGLYAMLHFEGSWQTWFFDEPDNFLGLAEIQPWLLRVLREVESSDRQVLIASHHPEMLDQLPITRLWRDDCGPVRAAKFLLAPSEELRPSEIIARGWEDPAHG